MEYKSINITITLPPIVKRAIEIAKNASLYLLVVSNDPIMSNWPGLPAFVSVDIATNKDRYNKYLL